MGTVVGAYRRLLKGYTGPHKESLQRLWNHAEAEGTLEQNLMQTFQDPDVQITADQFVELAGNLDGDELQGFYTDLESNEQFVEGMNKGLEGLPGVEASPGDHDLDPRGPEPIAPEPTVTKEGLDNMIADPRYGNDPAYRQEVAEAFQGVYGTESNPESSPSAGRTLHGAPVSDGVED